MADDPARLPFAVGLLGHARSIIRQNLYVSVTVIAVVILATILSSLVSGRQSWYMRVILS